MDIEKIKNPIKREHTNNDNLEEVKNCEKSESLFGLTRGKICENCENFTSLGQSVRRCQACAIKKYSLEKQTFHEELGREERLEIECDAKDEHVVITSSKFISETNKKLEENWNDSTKDLHNENFVVEHEHVDLFNANITKTPNLTINEDGKGVLKKKESVFLNKKENKTLSENESTPKKEKNWYSKGRFLLDKDCMMSNEKKEQIGEILDAQRTKEEIEKRERGWIVNNSVIGKNVTHSKVSSMKNIGTPDGHSLGKEQNERIKVKNLREKIDTQRVLGLVAKRSESRLNSPTHRLLNPSYKNEDIEVPSTINVKNSVFPSMISHEKEIDTSKSQQTHSEITINNKSGLNNEEIRRKSFYTNKEEEMLKSQSYRLEEVSKSKCLSPTNLGCYPYENILFGNKRILELLAKRNGTKVIFPKQTLDIDTSECESKSISYNAPKQQNETYDSSVTFYSSKLHDQQPKNLTMGVTLPCTTTNVYQKHDLINNNVDNKKSDFNYNVCSSAQIYKAQQELEHNRIISSTNTNCHFNDTCNQFHNMHQVLGLIAQRSENNITSPKKCKYYNTKNASFSNANENGFLKPNTVKDINEEILSCSKENQEVTPLTATHNLTSKLLNHNIMYKRNRDSKNIYEEVMSRSNSLELKISTPQSAICHVNDNSLYGTTFESESTNCTSNNINESHLDASNIPTLPWIEHHSISSPSKNTSNETLETKDNSPTLLLKDSSIYNSLDMTPLYKSAIATPLCKSPEPKKELKTSSFPIESRYHTKEVEIFEVDKSLSLKNGRIEELDTHKKDERCGKQKGSTLEVFHLENLVGSTRDILNKGCCEEKEKSNYSPKVTSYKKESNFQFIMWPIQIFFRITTYPFKITYKSISFILHLFKLLFLEVLKVFKMFKNTTIMGVDNIKSKILEKFQNRCNNTQRYSCCRFASKTYILIVFSSLLLPSLFDLDFYLVNRFIEGQVVIRKTLNFDYTKEHPTAMVNLLSQQIMGKAKGYFPDKEVMTAHAFPPSYIFHMIVHLTLPESQYNQEIGMFQIVIETFSARGYSLNKASRASMLLYHSPPVKYMKSIIMGVPIVLGLYQESQTLSIKMMESQEEKEYSPTATISVEIEPKVGHSTGLGIPEIYHAELQIIAHNPYLREVARKWVWNLYLCSGLALFVFEVLLVMFCCQRAFPKKIGGRKTTEGFSSKIKKNILERGQNFVQAPKKLHKGHIYYPKNLPLALPNISIVNDSKNTLSCSDATVEELKVIRLTENSIPKISSKL